MQNIRQAEKIKRSRHPALLGCREHFCAWSAAQRGPVKDNLSVKPGRAGRSGPKCETDAGGKNETGGPPPPGRERGPPPVAEQKKTAAKKAAPKKPKAEKPAVLTGTVPEWSSTGVIAQMLGFKGCRRVQQLTQPKLSSTPTSATWWARVTPCGP